jgi:hypothetical protein
MISDTFIKLACSFVMGMTNDVYYQQKTISCTSNYRHYANAHKSSLKYGC